MFHIMSIVINHNFIVLICLFRFESWKARISGYEDALVLFKQLDKKSHDWNKYTGIIKLFVVDGNAIAQKKGLAATLVFVENSETAGRSVKYNSLN